MIVRVIVGIVMMAASCAGIIICIKEDGLGCLGAVASGIACIVVGITVSILPAAELQTFWGMDYVSLQTAAGCLALFCLLLSETKFSGIIGCFVLFFTGLLVTGLLDASTVALVSDYVGDAGWIVFSPILIPAAIVIVFFCLI